MIINTVLTNNAWMPAVSRGPIDVVIYNISICVCFARMNVSSQINYTYGGAAFMTEDGILSLET